MSQCSPPRSISPMMRPARSSSCQRVWIRITHPPGASRVRRSDLYQSQILSRTCWESASSDAIGSIETPGVRHGARQCLGRSRRRELHSLIGACAPLSSRGICPILLTIKGTIMSKNRKPAREVSPCNATAMRKASRRLTQLYDDALEPCGLRSTQFAILAELGRRSLEPPTMRELADALLMDRAALGHNLRPLERGGLIALEESEEDRRRRHRVMTPQAKAKLKQSKRLVHPAQ